MSVALHYTLYVLTGRLPCPGRLDLIHAVPIPSLGRSIYVAWGAHVDLVAVCRNTI